MNSNLITSCLKILVLNLGIFLLVGNIGLWAIDPDLNIWFTDGYTTQMFTNFYDWHNSQPVTFTGFKAFFEFIETFPGFMTTHQVMSTWCNILMKFDITGLPVIDTIFAIMRSISAPLLLTGSIIVDIVRNVLWFFSFIFKDLVY